MSSGGHVGLTSLHEAQPKQPLSTMFRSQHLLNFVILWPLLLSIAHTQSNSKSQSRVFVTTSLVLAPWDARLSVIEVGSTATTYLDNNHNPNRNNSNTEACNAEAYDRVTIIAGPSTAALTYVYTECGTNQAAIHAINCPLTATDTATCTQVASSGNATTTVENTLNSSEASPQPCTITAGIEKLSAGAVTATASSGSSQSPPTSAPSTNGPGATSPATPNSAGFCVRVSFSSVLIAAIVVCVL